MAKPRSGNTAMRHARAVLEQGRVYPVIQYAGKRVVRLPAKKKGDPPRIIALAEDLLNGCFDALAVGAGHTLAVQVTSQTDDRSSVSHRKRKIEREFLKHYPPRQPPGVCVQLWAWVNREGFRVWEWEHGTRTWREWPEMLRSPELKR